MMMILHDVIVISDVSCFLRVIIGSGPSATQCLTCDLHQDRCQYNSAYFSFNASYYRMDCYGQLPTVHPLLSNNSFVALRFVCGEERL